MSFNAVVKVVKKVDNFEKVVRSLDGLKDRDVLIGVPQEDKIGREEGDAVTNAQLLFLHSEGAPRAGIVARPTIQPAIEENRTIIAQKYSIAIKQALNKKSPDATLEALGLFLQNKARAKFGSDELAELKESTKRAKARKITRGKGGKTKKQLQNDFIAGNGNPLIDTGELRKSVTYIIRRK